MNFFEHQQLARSQSRRLVLLFTVAVILIVLAVDVAALLAAAIALPSTQVEQAGFAGLAYAHAGLLGLVSLGTLAVIGVSSMFKTSQLRSGGGAVARQLGATLVPDETRSPSLRRLRNVVEEIAIASGVPVPEIYVLEQETGINAFAAGFSAADAAITVSQGCLDRLSRDELQGVIAHEFSHVLNGDMRLNIRLMGILFGILVIGLAARFVLQGSRGGSRSKGAGAILVAALLIMLVGYIGLFFGRLIKSGISRQREYLADASAVQFTRQTNGIAGALKKIGALPEGSRLAHAGTEEVSHMLFGDGVGYSRLMSTHPPLMDRISRLDPSFKPADLNAMAKAMMAAPHADQLAQMEADTSDQDGKRQGPFAGMGALDPAGIAAEPAGGIGMAVLPALILGQVGNPGDDDYRVASALHAGIPDALRQAARRSDEALALVLALVLDADESLRQTQVALIREHHDAALADTSIELYTQALELPPRERLPLAALAFPSLRRLPRAQLDRLVGTLDALIDADGRIGLFEYCLARLLRVQVTDTLDPSNARIIGSAKLSDQKAHAVRVLAIVGEQGADTAQQAMQAFQSGVQEIWPSEAIAFSPVANWIEALDESLAALDRLDGIGKQLLVAALVRTVSEDGRLSVEESELLRCICGSLHCPLPPVLTASSPP